MDLYAVLGVDRNASDKEIKAAYFEIAKTEHPDKGGDTAQFQDITFAYRILSNPVLRKRYDEDGSTKEFDDFAGLVRETVAGIFLALLEQIDQDVDLFELVRKEVNGRRGAVRSEIEKTRTLVQRAERVIKKIKGKNPLFANAARQRKGDLEKVMKGLERDMSLVEAMMSEVDGMSMETNSALYSGYVSTSATSWNVYFG